MDGGGSNQARAGKIDSGAEKIGLNQGRRGGLSHHERVEEGN